MSLLVMTPNELFLLHDWKGIELVLERHSRCSMQQCVWRHG
jgi:hypothetical protein